MTFDLVAVAAAVVVAVVDEIVVAAVVTVIVDKVGVWSCLYFKRRIEELERVYNQMIQESFGLGEIYTLGGRIVYPRSGR